MNVLRLRSLFFCFVICGACIAGNPKHESEEQTATGVVQSYAWKRTALQRLEKLESICDVITTQRRDLDHCELRAAKRALRMEYCQRCRNADQILVDLWRYTGLPTLTWDDDKENLVQFLRRNLNHYREFVDANSDATDEQIARMGVEASLDMLDSTYAPLASRYFSAKVMGCRLPVHSIYRSPFDHQVLIRSCFSTFPKEIDKKYVGIAREWYLNNGTKLKWNPQRMAFEGGDVGAFSKAVESEFTNSTV